LACPSFEGSFEVVAHTADIAVRWRASSPAGVFDAAAAALTEAMTVLNRGHAGGVL
jgi:SHS2 domain-containing protein